jgi:hypothetical protein
MARHSQIVTTKLPAGDPDDLRKVTIRRCAHCRKNFKGKGRAKFCSDACKQADYRRRQNAESDV